MSIKLRLGVAGLLATVALCGLAGDLSADDGANPARPFRGEASGVVTFLSPNEAEILATGEATHLGTFTREELLLLNADGTFGGLMIFTAANGDELRAEVEGQFTSADGSTAAGTYTFVGGTGRFADATGGADFEAETGAGPEGQLLLDVAFRGSIRY